MLVNIGLLMQLGVLSKVSSFCKLIRMICVILFTAVDSNFVGVSFSKSLRFVSGGVIGIILVKKSAFKVKLGHLMKLSVTIRV